MEAHGPAWNLYVNDTQLRYSEALSPELMASVLVRTRGRCITWTAARPTVLLVLHIDYWSGNNSRTSWGAYYHRTRAQCSDPGNVGYTRLVMLIKGNLSVNETNHTRDHYALVHIVHICVCVCVLHIRRNTIKRAIMNGRGVYVCHTCQSRIIHCEWIIIELLLSILYNNVYVITYNIWWII